jgi:hypothetical protein
MSGSLSDLGKRILHHIESIQNVDTMSTFVKQNLR